MVLSEISKYEKPEDLFIKDFQWKLLVRNFLKKKNTLLVGPSGTGKTISFKKLVEVFNQKENFYYFNLGSCQDPRSTFLGNMHYDPERGTFFDESDFIKAITKEGSIVLLDEISRSNPEGWNILLSVLDDHQRYIRLEEKSGIKIINVAKDVVFFATANVGSAYTSTRMMDRALIDRFNSTLVIEPLSKEDEFSFLKLTYPELDENFIEMVSEIADHTRLEIKKDSTSDIKLTNYLSTRSTKEMCELFIDGFSLEEISEICVYPLFSSEGGLESELIYIKQYLQKYFGGDSSNKLF